MRSTSVKFIVGFLLFCSQLGFAQKKIELTKISSGKQMVIKEGVRVIYVLKKGRRKRIGTLKAITDTSIQIGKNMISLKNVRSIGESPAKARALSILAAVAGGGLLGSVESTDSVPVIIIGVLCPLPYYFILFIYRIRTLLKMLRKNGR
ncbi:MAG: hypothetical protein ACJ75J_02125 [Cytophagaceae bacterium]